MGIYNRVLVHFTVEIQIYFLFVYFIQNIFQRLGHTNIVKLQPFFSVVLVCKIFLHEKF